MTDMTYAQHMAIPAFMVICDGACDQICSTKKEADRERNDLRKMGHDDVRVRSFASWAEAHAYEDKLNAR